MSVPLSELLRRLAETQTDTQAQSALAAEFVLASRPEPERQSLRATLDVAAVLRWFNATLLAKMLEISNKEAQERFEVFKALPFVESYRSGEQDLRDVHESTRLAWRTQLAEGTPGLFRALSAAAAKCFSDDQTPAGRIEWIYHLLCSEPDYGATQLESLDRNWSNRAWLDDRYALAAALDELEKTRFLQGRARLWVFLVLAWTRQTKGDEAHLLEPALAALKLARDLGDLRAEFSAQGLAGDAFQAKGNLTEALSAYGRCLEVGKQLAQRSAADVELQRDLVLAHLRIAKVLKVQGKLKQAYAAIEHALAISRQLADQDPSIIHSRALAASYNQLGLILEEQSELSHAHEAFEEALAISRRVAAQEPRNLAWRRDLAVCLSQLGHSLLNQGKLTEAEVANEEVLTIARTLADQDPGNAQWQDDLGTAYANVGRALQEQGKLEEGRAAYDESLTIRRRLAEHDPEDAHRQWSLAAVYRLLGGVQVSQGEINEAQEAYAQYLSICERLTEMDPSNAAWQRELAVAFSEMGDMLAARGEVVEGLRLWTETLAINRRWVANDEGGAAWRRETAVTLGRVGELLVQVGDVSKGLAASKDSLTMSRLLVERDSANVTWQRDLAVQCAKVARLLLSSANDHDVALSLYEEAIHIFSVLAESSPGFAQWRADRDAVELELARCRELASNTEVRDPTSENKPPSSSSP
jgi:tetratricopeptide (TPR) repeat protein